MFVFIGKVVATKTVPLTLPWDETFDVGSDTGTSLDDGDYAVPFAFTGKLDKLTVDVIRPDLTADDIKKLAEAEAAVNDSAGPAGSAGFPGSAPAGAGGAAAKNVDLSKLEACRPKGQGAGSRPNRGSASPSTACADHWGRRYFAVSPAA